MFRTFACTGTPTPFVPVFIASRWPNRQSEEKGAVRSNAPGSQRLKSKLSPTIKKRFSFPGNLGGFARNRTPRFSQRQGRRGHSAGDFFQRKQGYCAKTGLSFRPLEAKLLANWQQVELCVALRES